MYVLVVAALLGVLILAACVLLAIAVYEAPRRPLVDSANHVMAALTGALVLAACMLLVLAVEQPLSFELCIVAIVAAEVFFPACLLVSSAIGKVKGFRSLPPSVRVACVPFLPVVPYAVIGSIIAGIGSIIHGRQFLQTFFGGESGAAHPTRGLQAFHGAPVWIVHAAALAVGCWGSYILYKSIRPKQTLEPRL